MRLKGGNAVLTGSEGSSENIMTTVSNITAIIRLTGHLYNRNLLQKALDIVENKNGITQSVDQPIMGGSKAKASTVTIKVESVRNKVYVYTHKNSHMHTQAHTHTHTHAHTHSHTVRPRASAGAPCGPLAVHVGACAARGA